MRKYENLFILCIVIVMMILSFVSVQYMHITQMVLLLVFVVFFVMYKSSITFLSKEKYIILISILLYFFVLRLRDWGNVIVSDEVVFLSDTVVFFESLLLVFILLRVDRFNLLSNTQSNKDETL